VSRTAPALDGRGGGSGTVAWLAPAGGAIEPESCNAETAGCPLDSAEAASITAGSPPSRIMAH